MKTLSELVAKIFLLVEQITKRPLLVFSAILDPETFI